MTDVTRTLIVLMTLTLAIVAPAWAQQTHQPCADLPANIEADARLGRYLMALITKSPTLRRQCEIIARAPQVRIAMRYANNLPSYCRAWATISRQVTQVRIVILLPVSAELPRLLAHEFEHVVEALEGVDLTARARIKGSGVSEVMPGIFETTRAQRVGRQAEKEVFGS